MDVVNNKITCTHDDREPVLVKIVIQTKVFPLKPHFHFFGDDPLQTGQPVVDSNNQLVLDGNGNVVLYTAATIVDRQGNQKFHRRGEQIYHLDGTTWTPSVYTTSDLRKYLGNEPVLYVGGEPAFYTAADSVLTPQTFHQITLGQQPMNPAAPSAANKVQLLGVIGTPAGSDRFTLTFGNASVSANKTGPLSFSATAAQIRAELAGLASIKLGALTGLGNVNVTGVAGGPWTVTFQGNLGDVVPMLIAQVVGTTSASIGVTAVARGSVVFTGLETATVRTGNGDDIVTVANSFNDAGSIHHHNTGGDDQGRSQDLTPPPHTGIQRHLPSAAGGQWETTSSMATFRRRTTCTLHQHQRHANDITATLTIDGTQQ